MGGKLSKDYASQRNAENELLASHQRLWASVSSGEGVYDVVLDKVGRKYFANGYTIGPTVNIGIDPIITIIIHKHHETFERLKDNKRIPIESNEQHQKLYYFSGISDVASAVSAFAAPVQIWQAHREHRLNRLRSVLEARDAEVNARVTAQQSIRMNSISTAIAHEEMQFDVFADSVFFNKMKFKNTLTEPATCALVYRIENAAGLYGTESQYKWLIKKLPNNNIESEMCTNRIQVSTDKIEYRRTRIMFTTSGKVFMKPMELRYSREGVMTLLPGENHAFIAATDKMKPVSAEQLKWTLEDKGDWLSLVGFLGELACACNYIGIPREARKVQVRTQWPAPVIYALCAMIRHYARRNPFRINSDGIIYIKGESIEDILSYSCSEANYEIDGHLSLAWDVITDRVYSLAVGSENEESHKKKEAHGHNICDIVEPAQMADTEPAQMADTEEGG